VSSDSRRVLDLILVLSLATILTWLLYAPTVGYGLYYDDYHFVRPYTTASVLSAFAGPWDPTGIETAYYRPLTICLYAARFAAVGFDARANHLASLIGFAFAGTLFGLFAHRISGSRTTALIGTAAFALHPGMPYSAVAWITNQMHLAELIVVFASFIWWFHVRARAAFWWGPLLTLQVVAFLIKEDGIMLVPAILALHVLRKYLVERGLRWPPWSFVAAAVCIAGALLLLRSAALHGVPSHRLPSFDQAWDNWSRGLRGAFRLLPAKRAWQPEASWFATLVPLLALVLWRRIRPELRFAAIAGLVIGVLFVLPFAFIIKAEQLHLVNSGAALLLAASLAGLLQAFPSRRWITVAVSALALAGLTAMAVVARDITRDFEPYGPVVLHTDRIVEEWAAVPIEWREYLVAKAAAAPDARPDPDPSRAVPVVAFGLHERERSPDGTPLRWMAGPVSDIFVRRGTRLVTFSARHERGAFGEPAHVRVEADGRIVTDTILDDGRRHAFDVALPQRTWRGFSGAHHLRIVLDHAWIPAKVIRGSRDDRTLGLQIGDIQTR
jgi:hypothetical protein